MPASQAATFLCACAGSDRTGAAVIACASDRPAGSVFLDCFATLAIANDWLRATRQAAARCICQKSSPGERQGDLQPWRVVGQGELAAMQPRDRGGEAQAEARARLRAALLEAHEPLKHPATI